MLIECLIRRKNGSTVLIDGRLYKFAPDDSGRHVCEVSLEEHAKKILRVNTFAEVSQVVEEEVKPLDISAVINSKDKNELAEYAYKNFGLMVDKRKTPERILKDIIEAANER